MIAPRRPRIGWGAWIGGLGLAWLTIGWAGASWAQTALPPEPQAPPPLDGPTTTTTTELDPLPPSSEPGGPPATLERESEPEAPASARSPDRTGAAASSSRVYAPKAPPAPIAERPSGRRPHRRARWITGHWEWDGPRAAFVWASGSWHVPPAGSIWVAGSWRRDARGWYWSPGFWSTRRGARGEGETVVAAPAIERRTVHRATAPPAERPDDAPSPAPGPNYFYVPGHYAPSGADDYAWKPGFWARTRSGWDWVPARWARRADGWEYREGFWTRDPNAPAPIVVPGRTSRRRFAARPPVLSTPPIVSDGPAERAAPSPETDADAVADADADVEGTPGHDRLPPTPDELAAGQGAIVGPPVRGEEVVIGPVSGMPYYVVRPPGSYPYGPGGVLVPGVVPPFVRRILDRVLP